MNKIKELEDRLTVLEDRVENLIGPLSPCSVGSLSTWRGLTSATEAYIYDRNSTRIRVGDWVMAYKEDQCELKDGLVMISPIRVRCFDLNIFDGQPVAIDELGHSYYVKNCVLICKGHKDDSHP
jgi:hypothetical protein